MLGRKLTKTVRKAFNKDGSKVYDGEYWSPEKQEREGIRLFKKYEGRSPRDHRDYNRASDYASEAEIAAMKRRGVMDERGVIPNTLGGVIGAGTGASVSAAVIGDKHRRRRK